MVQIIDAHGLIAGRLASHVAKLALQGEKVIVVNSEKAVLSGNRKMIEREYLEAENRGVDFHGPFFPRRADMLLRRTIRGMLPWKRDRGRKAFKRIMCYIGVPNQYASQKLDTIESASVDKLSVGKYVELGKISARLGLK